MLNSGAGERCSAPSSLRRDAAREPLDRSSVAVQREPPVLGSEDRAPSGIAKEWTYRCRSMSMFVSSVRALRLEAGRGPTPRTVYTCVT